MKYQCCVLYEWRGRRGARQEEINAWAWKKDVSCVSSHMWGLQKRQTHFRHIHTYKPVVLSIMLYIHVHDNIHSVYVIEHYMYVGAQLLSPGTSDRKVPYAAERIVRLVGYVSHL